MSPPVRSRAPPLPSAASEADVEILRTRTAPPRSRTWRRSELDCAVGLAPWCLAAVAFAQPARIAVEYR